MKATKLISAYLEASNSVAALVNSDTGNSMKEFKKVQDAITFLKTKKDGKGW